MTNTIFLIPIILVGIIALFLITNPLDESFLGSQLESFTPINWDDVIDRNIVKNTVLIQLKELQGNLCKVHSDKFQLIVDHNYFINSNKLVNELKFDNSTNTLFLQCDKLKGDTSSLHVWYVLEEAPRHAGKYEIFVTELGSYPDAKLDRFRNNTTK
ncbi:MAG: hypothetical protein HRU07_00735 [Nitrosopumilus sp.]|nr:hypothetical protein [Nitrosopumilus sp.]NRA04703.1 hypothetical protein [Nitrosopumilus sp.]